MTIFIRFDSQGSQMEAIQCSNRPGLEWKTAPKDFSWEKRYKRVQDQVKEMTEADLEEENLQIQKGLVLSNLQQKLHAILESIAPLRDIPQKMMEAQAAQAFLDNEKDTKAQEALQPLANVWNLSLQETAQKLQQEAEKMNRLLLLVRTYQEKATFEIKDISSLEELETYSSFFIVPFEKEVQEISGGSR